MSAISGIYDTQSNRAAAVGLTLDNYFYSAQRTVFGATHVFPVQLSTGIWHTTRPDRFRAIVATGFIFPDPETADGRRARFAVAPQEWSYVKSLGAVSLFSFEGFDPQSYERVYRSSSWRRFVPCPPEEQEAIWIEVDRALIAAQYIAPRELFSRWQSGQHRSRQIMPMIEGAHVGPIPTTAFRSVLTWRGIWDSHAQPWNLPK